jgi:glycosyltransferase involved in cell wall biosynthesis
VKGSVLIIGNFLSSAGGSRGVCEDLAERLANSGWKVVTASRKRPRLVRLADMVLTAIRHRQEYSVAQLDVFSGPAFVWAEMVCWTLRRLGKPYVLTLHGGNLPTFAARWPSRVKRLLSSAKAVTAPSGYLKEKLEPYGREIKVIPNPIDISRYPFRERSPAKPKLVWLRAFHEIYNPVMAVKVVSALAGGFPEVELSMIGPGKGDGSLERVRAEVGRLKLEERVRIPGAVPKTGVPKALNSGDIFLNTSNVDNTPVSIIEAMAAGLCIVSTEVGGVAYLCEKGKEALVVPANGAKAMASAVRSILVDAGLSGRLSRSARAKAERFSWSEVLPKWECLLTETGPKTLKATAWGEARRASSG